MNQRLKILFRNIVRERLSTFIIVLSLTIGIACITLLSYFVIKETGVDKFNPDADRTYALQMDDIFDLGFRPYWFHKDAPSYLVDNFDQFEDNCLFRDRTTKTITVANESYYDAKIVLLADENFFDFFNYKLISKKQEDVLATKNDVVISDKLAEKYFGDKDPLGQLITIKIGNEESKLSVTGVFQVPECKSHLKFDIVKKVQEADNPYRAYLKLKEGVTQEEANKLLVDYNNEIPSIFNIGEESAINVASFKEMYYDTKRNGNFEISRSKTDVVAAIILAIVVLIIAAFNYLGLANARLLNRAKSYTIQIINGNSKIGCIQQFLTENVLLIVMSFVLSWGIIYLALPFFNQITDSQILFTQILLSKHILVAISTVLVLVVSSFLFVWLKTVTTLDLELLKSKNSSTGNSKFEIPVFNVIQLASVVVLIIMALVIRKQNIYIINKPIGISKEVIEVRLPWEHVNLSQVFKDEFQKSPLVENASIGLSPFTQMQKMIVEYNNDGIQKQYTMGIFNGDADYLSTLEMEIIDGHGFTGNPNVDEGTCLVNESVVKSLGDFLVLGDRLPGLTNKVIGVVKDFHYLDLKSNIEPSMVAYSNSGNAILLKPKKGYITGAFQLAENTWDKLLSNEPKHIEVIEDTYQALHKESQNYIMLISSFAVISILLSMVGLFAVSIQTCKIRTKEIGIRKVNGATIAKVISTLNIDFLKWLLIANCVAIPLSWYLSQHWLQHYLYRTELSWWIFILSGIITILVAIITVSWQSWKTATRNPVEALRYE